MWKKLLIAALICLLPLSAVAQPIKLGAGVNNVSQLPECAGDFYLQTEGSDGSTTIEEYANRVDITVYGNVHHDNVQAKFGSTSLYFDGTDDSLGFDADAYILSNLTSWTMEAWIRMDTVIESCFFCEKTSPATNRAYQFGATATGGLQGYYYDTGGGSRINFYGTGAGSIVADTWHHYVVQKSYPQTTRFFVDGVQVAIDTSSGYQQYNSSALKTLNGYIYSGTWSQEWTGWMEEVRIDLDEALYDTGGFTPPTGPLCP
jgi:hypothetical protein